jgi:hypothetical protein
VGVDRDLYPRPAAHPTLTLAIGNRHFRFPAFGMPGFCRNDADHAVNLPTLPSPCPRSRHPLLDQRLWSSANRVTASSATSATGNTQWALAVSTVSAGVKEEPFFAALAVLGLGFLRVPIVAIVVISASARAVLHLYQGVGSAITAFVWGGVAVCAYYLFRNIWGLVVGHMLFNVGVLASVADARWLVVTSFSILVGVAIVSMVGQVGAWETFGAKNVSDSPANVTVGNSGVGDG